MARKVELDLDLNDKIFENDSERRELHAQMAQLSPRRAISNSKFEVMTLPFCEEISPSTALDKLFKLFHARGAGPDDDGSESQSGEEDEDDDRSESDESETKMAQAISRDEFNRLRRCIGKPAVTEREWKRAMEELGMPEGEEHVRKKDFKALFGPPPFFGSENVQGIVKYVMGAEEHIHFARILLDRFGIDVGGSGGVERMIGHEELRNIQTACCVDVVYGEVEWKELQKKLLVPEARSRLNWMEFAEAFTVTIKGKKVFGSEGDPASVVYAVLANEKVLETIKNPDEPIVSQKAFTNLLKLKKKKVDDDKWMQLLEQMQNNSYKYRKGRRRRKDSITEEDMLAGEEDHGHGTEAPLVVVRNTRNQVLSYDITFDEHGDLGLELQSDFYGHCLTVASIRGQAAKHPIVQKHDIVAMVNGKSMTYDTMAESKAEEQDRVAEGMRHLQVEGARKITFQRQESYFQYDNEKQTLHLFMTVLEEVPSQGKFSIQLPSGLSWAPADYEAGKEDECLSVKFEVPVDQELDYSTVRWNPSMEAVEVTLEGYVSIAANSSVVMQIGPLLCGDKKLVGPMEVSDGTLPAPLLEGQTEAIEIPTHFVTLYTDWKNRETTLQRGPPRQRVKRLGEFTDNSLEPIVVDFNQGDSGITLASDFFGQCAVVGDVKKLSQAAGKIEKHDILTSITYIVENDSIDTLNCIKPFALNKQNANAHIKDVRKRLTDSQKSGRRYQLHFLRLNSHFFHDNGRTIFTLRALTNLNGGSALVVKMPSVKWHANGPLAASVVEPSGVKIKEVSWDSKRRTVHMILDECSIVESTEVVVELKGIVPGGKIQCAGPGEVVGVHHGDDTTVPEMEFELHEHWHSFVVGHQSLDASKVVATLKQFDTSPAKLWQVLEYTSLLFEMYKRSEDTDYMSLTELNRLIRIVCGDEKTMQKADWDVLCRNMGAQPSIGLTRRQFACCWYDVVGLSSHNAQDIYVRLHTAERLFKQLVEIYQGGGDDPTNLLTEETIKRLAGFLGFSAVKTEKALKHLNDKGLQGWDCDTFSQVVCGKHPIVSIEEKDAMALWMKLFYSRRLFDTYSAKKLMRKKNLTDLLAAARISEPKLTNDVWTKICDSVGINDNGGLQFAKFLDVYAGNLLGSRHAMADWYRIETFKMLPERRAREDNSKEAVLSVAPERVNVKDVAQKALEETASTEELLQDLLEQGLEFSKLEKVEEKVSTTFKFESSLVAKRKSRSAGYLNIEIRSITELADHIIQQDPEFNKEDVAQELYVLFQVTKAEGLRPRLPEPKKRSRFSRVMEKLFGEKDTSNEYMVKEDEMWDQGKTQTLMRAMHDTEELLKKCKPRSPEYAAALATLHEIERQLSPPPPPRVTDVPDWRVFSSLKLRDPSPDAIIRFPDDHFRVFVPPHTDEDQLYIVCKLFKRIGSDASRLQLELDAAMEALKKADGTYAILQELVDRQEEHLRHTIAEEHMQGIDAKNDSRSQVWTSVSKLKQKRQDLAEFQVEVTARRNQVQELTANLAQAREAQDAELRRLQEEGAVLFPVAPTPPVDSAGAPAKRPSIIETGASAPAKRPSIVGTGATAPAKRPSMFGAKQEIAKAPPSKPKLEARRVKFIGQAFFDLNALLDVLHDDKEHTEDLAVFRTESHNDVGVVLLYFEYKCASLQEQSVATELSKMAIRMAADDVMAEEINEVALRYPSDSHLEIDWKADALERGDRICLIREGMKFNTSMPYFLLLWNAVDKKGKPKPFHRDDDNEDDSKKKKRTSTAETELFDWCVPNILMKVYSHPRDNIVTTDPSKRMGHLRFPSAVDLSLPPGIYKIYLIRNETIQGVNTRSILGTSASLAVLPGVNGVHTSFGTTPLVDVKPLSASLQVFSEADREAVSSALTNTDGYSDDKYLRRIAVEQELEVVKLDYYAATDEYERLKTKKEGKLFEKKIPELRGIIDQLERQKQEIIAAAQAEAKDLLASPDQVALKINSGAARSHMVISSTGHVVFAFNFYGEMPSPHDRILVLPADVVRVSDLLRSTILGKLQANDPHQVELARSTMERELIEVEEFFNGRMSFKTLKKIIWRYIKPYLMTENGGAGATDKSDAYKAATGAMDQSFVWEECLSHFNTAPSETRKAFPFIIRDLLDEIGARKELLGLKANESKAPKSKFAMAATVMKCGAEIQIPPLATTFKVDEHGRRMAIGEVSAKLGYRFRQGGFYVAKYVRRAKVAGKGGDDSQELNETAGELCRYGPFFVERAMFSYSPIQLALVAGKWLISIAKSEQGMLTLKIVGQFYLALIKYFLAVVSLSFNINVLAGNFNIDGKPLLDLLETFRSRLMRFYGPLETVLTTIYTFFSGYIQELMEKLDLFEVAGECMGGFFLFAVLGMLFSATFVVYVVVQEDLLLKVQKLHTYLPFNPGKTALGALEQIGALLVIPLYLSIKSCVLFISGNWKDFYHKLNDDPHGALPSLKLFRGPTPMCPNGHLAQINYGFGVAALVLIVFFLFVCLPLLLLDLYSWVPLTELEEKETLKKLSHSYKRLDIKAAVHSNANLVEFHPIRDLRRRLTGCTQKLRCCKSDPRREYTGHPLLAGFERHYDDYMNMAFRDLLKKYGYIGLFIMFVNIYAHLMLQSIGRALSIFLAWRLQASHMYTNPLMKPTSKRKPIDIFCLRFNIAWKLQYIKDKMLMPIVNIFMVTLGLWGEPQWKEFNVEERANDCYRMEPSGETKQLQMMSLQGKIISLFWLCVPETMVLAYLAEVLNRGPVFSYFLNRQFLQADIPDSERERDPVWRFHWRLGFQGEEDVVYLSDTRFFSTALKWGSSIVEIVSLLMVYPPAAKNKTVLFGITLISAVVTPLLELNQQMIKAYMDYVESAENLAKSTGLMDKLEKAKNLAKKAKELKDQMPEDMPEVDVNTPMLLKWLRNKKQTPQSNQPPQPANGQALASGTAALTGVEAGKGDDNINPAVGTVAAEAPSATNSTGAAASTAPGASTASSVAHGAAAGASVGVGATLASQVVGPSGTLMLGGGGDTSDRHDDEDDDDDDGDNAGNEGDGDEDGEDPEGITQQTVSDAALTSLVAASGLIKPTKQLILLNAMPQVSYVVLTDALDVGEGELTISWQVDAKQRFHAQDAIGMFPARAPGDMKIRTMEDCICYRLVKQKDVEQFGWSPKNENDDAERELIMRQARSLRDISDREVSKMVQRSIEVRVGDDEDIDEVKKARAAHHEAMLGLADSTINTMMGSPKLKPYRKKLPDILEEEVIANKIHLTSPRTSRANSLARVVKEEAAKKARKVVSGQVKFRPANNNVPEDHPKFETFLYGNDAGIYQSKYGLHGYEFCYLRCLQGEGKSVGLAGAKEKAMKEGSTGGKTQKVVPTEPTTQQYEILDRFVSNSIQIGTFNIFMSLTCDRPLVGAKEKLNLSWIIYGVAYSILSNPKSRNCIGFYKVDGSKEETCARIEIVPPSAYLEAYDNEPCPGRMTVNTPNEPGVYEIRFLFNFFKKAQLHRQCQVFGILEDEMQQLRIRSFYEKRAVGEELRKFALREPKVWGIARMNTHAWLKAMLLSTIREPVDPSVMESTTDYAEFLFGHLKKKLKQGVESSSPIYQRRIGQILAPIRLNSFLDVLMVALQSNSQMNDQLASITFISPTEEDEKRRGLNKERDALLLPADKYLYMMGSVSFRPLAVNYLNQPSLCGYHDFVDDILLNHGQMMQTLDQTMGNLTSSAVILYESAIRRAIEDMKTEAKALNLEYAMQGIDVMLIDLCRNHIQSLIRALLETDCRTGMRWPGQPPGSFEKITKLRTGSSLQAEADAEVEVVVEKPLLEPKSLPLSGGAVPLTREYIALRRWIRPKLERKIIAIMKQRHSRMMDGNWSIAFQVVASCRRPGLSLAGNPFPNHRQMRTDSPVYFLEERLSGAVDRKRQVKDGAVGPEAGATASIADGHENEGNQTQEGTQAQDADTTGNQNDGLFGGDIAGDNNDPLDMGSGLDDATDVFGGSS